MPFNITQEFVQQLLEQIAQLTKQVSELTAEISDLQQTIKELEEKKNRNSKNSSKPPFIRRLCEKTCKPPWQVG